MMRVIIVIIKFREKLRENHALSDSHGCFKDEMLTSLSVCLSTGK